MFYGLHMTTVAVFDLDNTLIEGSSLFQLARELRKRRWLSMGDFLKLGFEEFRYVNSRSESGRSNRDITTFALQLVRGRRQEDVQALCSVVVAKILAGRINSEVLSYLRHHQKLGHETWLATASPIEIALPLAAALGMNGAVATTAELVNGLYTGRLPDGRMHGAAKASAVMELARANQWNLPNSYAYSDSVNDLPLLCSVGTPTVVNANRRLIMTANKNGWRVLEKSNVKAGVQMEKFLHVLPQHEKHPTLRLTNPPGRDFNFLVA